MDSFLQSICSSCSEHLLRPGARDWLAELARVCRTVLGDRPDVDDALQATFLVLVRRAGSIRQRESVGPWLYGVARKVAERARYDAARRRAREAPTAELDPLAKADPRRCDADDQRILHEEIGRLRPIYRDPVVLCYLQDLTHAEAARRLGLQADTVSKRLERARKKLTDRLTSRGVDNLWARGLLIGRPAAGAGRAALPSPLVRSTVAAAVRWASGNLVTGAAAELAREVLRSMATAWLTRIGVGCLLVIVSVATLGVSSSIDRRIGDQVLRRLGSMEVMDKSIAKIADLFDSTQFSINAHGDLAYIGKDGSDLNLIRGGKKLVFPLTVKIKALSDCDLGNDGRVAVTAKLDDNGDNVFILDPEEPSWRGVFDEFQPPLWGQICRNSVGGTDL
jgi:RNA polymerase sigma factor (sigma-70 family)